MNGTELLNYIIDFVSDPMNAWEDENFPEQLRAFFTTWCFVNHVDADTDICDETLRTIYYRAVLENVIEYDEWENFMVGLIV